MNACPYCSIFLSFCLRISVLHIAIPPRHECVNSGRFKDHSKVIACHHVELRRRRVRFAPADILTNLKPRGYEAAAVVGQ